jgi:membrane-bound metal-dependent hydrolase YbcI (DUF457 family)
MMGPGHAVSGLIVGLAVAQAAGLTLSQAYVAAAICAGAALLPDIDNPSATVSRVFGPASQAFSRVVNDVSGAVYRGTKTRVDKDRDGGHRGLTHTWPFAVAVGMVSTWAATYEAGMLAILFLCLSLALRGLAADVAKRLGWIATTLAALACTATVAIWFPPLPGWTGLLVGFGCLVHCWGDSLTLAGCPWLWPFVIRGKRWYDVATPGFLRFRAGGTGERWVMMPLMITGAAAEMCTIIPGGWAWLGAL